MNLFNNILTNYLYLRKDFSSISFNFFGISDFINSLLLSIFLILLFKFLGEKIGKFFFSLNIENSVKDIFLSLAFGYIFFCTGIALLGVFSLLYNDILVIYIILLAFIAFSPFYRIKTNLYNSYRSISVLIKNVFCANKIGFIFLSFFVFINFLKLLTPEIGVDSVFYHHDYPKEYLRIHSLMEVPKGNFFVMMTPQLGQMIYVIFQAFGFSFGPRIFQFLFFILVLLVIIFIASYKSISKTSIFPSLVIASSPIIIAHMSFGYVDAQWLFCWLLLFWMLTFGKIDKQNVIMAGILGGGILASKIESSIFFATAVLFIFFKSKNEKRFENIFLFLFFCFTIPSLWYIRSFLLTGNPIYPIFSLQGQQPFSLGQFSIASYIDRIKNLILNFNPFILISFASLAILSWKKLNKLLNNSTFLYSLILSANYIFLPQVYFLGRFLFYGFSIFSFLILLKENVFTKTKLFSYGLYAFCTIMGSYYLINQFLIIPYGFAWANTNAYLTRILARDDSSYYDFNHLFSKYISAKDFVATYQIQGFYYANFQHKDIAYFLEKNNSLQSLENKGITKVLIKHSDMKLFCKQNNISQCNAKNYRLLAYYPPAEQYLYSLK